MEHLNNNVTFNSFKDLTVLKDQLEQSEKKVQQIKSKSQALFDMAKPMMQELQKTYPLAFNAVKPIPLALGIEKKILKKHPDFAPAILKFALSIWTRREAYLLAVISSEKRYDLSGLAAGGIPESEKMYSQMRLEKKRKSNEKK